MIWKFSYHVTTHYFIYIPRLNELYIASRSLAEPVDQVELLSFTPFMSIWMSFAACRRRFPEVHQRAKSDQVNILSNKWNQFFPSVINLTDLAIKRIIKMAKQISAFTRVCQEDQVGLCTSSPPWFSWSSFSSGVTAQGWLHRAHDPQVCRQLRLGAERLAGGRFPFSCHCNFLPLSRYQEVRTKGFSAWMS